MGDNSLPNLGIICKALKIVYEVVGISEKDMIIKKQQEEIKKLQGEFRDYIRKQDSEMFCSVCDKLMMNSPRYECQGYCGYFCGSSCGHFCTNYSDYCHEAYCNKCISKSNFYNYPDIPPIGMCIYCRKIDFYH